MQKQGVNNTSTNQPAANTVAEKLGFEPGLELLDNRPEGILQRKFQLLANNSARVKKLGTIQKMIHENLSGTNSAGLENASNEVTVQRVRETDGGGKIFEQEDALKKKQMVAPVLEKLQAKLVDVTGTQQEPMIREQIRKLQDMLAKYDLMPHTEAFVSVMSEQEPAVGNTLYLDLEFADYKVGDDVADGEYQFVILVSDPGRVLMTKGSGHQSIAGDNPVYYAGTAYFTIGELVYWNNNTGHFRTDEAHAPQAEIPKLEGVPYLPMAKFRLFVP